MLNCKSIFAKNIFMHIAVITNKEKELIFDNINTTYQITYINDINLLQKKYDVVFDFLYEDNKERNNLLGIAAQKVFVNYVNGVTTENTKNLIRFNGWETMCNKTPIEISHYNNNALHGEAILNQLQLPFINVPNTLGMVTPKVVSMLVNEAYFALGDGVSTEIEIDIAMQLGTNYPYGPFAWSKKIGLKNIVTLLTNLCIDNERYTLAPALLNEVN